MKVKGKTVLKDKVKIPNGLQAMVERQARHDAERAGDLQHTDNPYAPGGAKFGFDFMTGRAPVGSKALVLSTRPGEEDQAMVGGSRGKRGGGSRRPFVRRGGFAYQPGHRFSNQTGFHHDIPTGPSHQYVPAPPMYPGRQYPSYRSVKPVATPMVPRIQPAETRTT